MGQGLEHSSSGPGKASEAVRAPFWSSRGDHRFMGSPALCGSQGSEHMWLGQPYFLCSDSTRAVISRLMFNRCLKVALKKKKKQWNSLAIQWLGPQPPSAGAQVPFLVGKDLACRVAKKRKGRRKKRKKKKRVKSTNLKKKFL